jgi:Prp31 C terminal domain
VPLILFSVHTRPAHLFHGPCSWLQLQKWEEPDAGKIKKALPKPDEAPKSRRGGKKVRRIKDKFAITDVQKEQNKMGFASDAYEYGDSAMVSGDTPLCSVV